MHDQHDSITLPPGNYVAVDIDLDFPATINVLPGLVTIFVTGHLSVGGHVNLPGSPRDRRSSLQAAKYDQRDQ
jgi:hypothetical protein